MKKVYEAPEMEVEMFTADEAIAYSNDTAQYIPGRNVNDAFREGFFVYRKPRVKRVVQ